jgi:hypothetical protein
MPINLGESKFAIEQSGRPNYQAALNPAAMTGKNAGIEQFTVACSTGARCP